MPSLKVAHLYEQGQNMIIVPLDSQFEYQSEQQQRGGILEIQTAAASAGLAGIVVVVWTVGGKMKFIAPPNWHVFFKSINYNFVVANLNKEISW